jgi:YegS/Rv2252/BmrU family lipid kinase
MSEAPASDERAVLTPPGQAVRALVIVNAQAGLGLWPGAQPAVEHLRAAGWLVDLAQTEYQGHATELARQAMHQGYHLVIGCGGDGTLNEIVQALAGSETVLGIVPTGTANVLAREMGIPLDPLGAAEVLLTGRIRVMDLGRAGERAFIMMAGIGLDAEVVREVQDAPRRPPRFLKAFLLTLGTVLRFFTYPGTPMRLTIDGQEERGRVMMVVVGNIRSYAGVFQITHEATWDDGCLDIVVFFTVGLVAKIGNFLSLLLRRHKRRPGVAYFRARRVHIWTPAPVPVQADGDIVGDTPMTFRSEPRALRVVLPHRPA